MAVMERVANVTVVLAAIVITGITVLRQFPLVGTDRRSDSPEAQLIPGWQEILSDSVANRRGSPGGVEVVEFIDLECPFCALHYAALEERLQTDSTAIAYTMVHLPLRGHRFALPAARAAECAREEGRFFELVHAILRKQDSLGLKSWGSFARDAGLSDTLHIAKCAVTPGDFPRIARGTSLAKSLGITSTPTVIIDGYRLRRAPTAETLIAVIDSVVSNRRRR